MESVPGTVAHGTEARTDAFWSWHTVYPYGVVPYRWLVDYGPTTTSGTTTVTYTLEAVSGPEGPSLSFSKSVSYGVSDVVVHGLSDLSEGRAEWVHDLAEDKSVGADTYLAKPGFVVETRQNIASLVDAQYAVIFSDPPKWYRWSWADKLVGPSDILWLDAYKSGD